MIAFVCELYFRGMTVKKILKELEDRYGEAGKVSRETPMAFIRYAAERKWIHYHAPKNLPLEQFILNSYMWLKRVSVVHTAVTEDVARETASMLLRLVQECYRTEGKTGEVHIGFAAGLSMQKVARAFADILCDPAPDLPKKIVIHSLVTGFEPGNPTTDPNTFFTFYVNRPTMQVETRFVSLFAPCMVQTRMMPQLLESKEIHDTFRAANDLDIIVTSGSDWADEHSSLLRCMDRSKESLGKLLRAGTVGDMLWRPIGKEGPVKESVSIRMMTLLELEQLSDFIQNKRYVLLMLGSCGKCKRPKGEILHTILKQNPQLITHLVVDSRSARQLEETVKREKQRGSIGG
jgi:DNA-binding transcriptional regulator LsrR (DeoR family)